MNRINHFYSHLAAAAAKVEPRGMAALRQLDSAKRQHLKEEVRERIHQLEKRFHQHRSEIDEMKALYLDERILRLKKALARL